MLDRDMIVDHIASEMVLTQDAKLQVRKFVNGMATDSVATTYSIEKVRPRRLSKRDAALDPQLLAATERVFEVYANYLALAGAPQPRKDDRIIDCESRTWVILKVDASISGQVLNCFCRRDV